MNKKPRPWRWVPAVLASAVSIASCGSPTTPSPPTVVTAQAPAAAVPSHIEGFTADTAYQTLTGVTVEIVDGALAGTSVVTDQDGHFAFNATASGAVTLRASKDGYKVLTMVKTWQPVDPHVYTAFVAWLEPIAASLSIPLGAYTMTLVGDSSCTAVPRELLTRTYSAVVSPQAGQTHIFDVEVSGPTLPSFGFGLGVAGSVVGFTIDGPTFSEALPQFTYVEIAGNAPLGPPAPPPTSTGSTITIPFSGSFEYCVLTGPMGRNNNCFTTPPAQRVAYGQCGFDTVSLMILTQR